MEKKPVGKEKNEISFHPKFLAKYENVSLTIHTHLELPDPVFSNKGTVCSFNINVPMQR
jgi:hypothetical protein